MRYLLMCATLLSMWSCTKKPNQLGEVDAYVPIYGNFGELKVITQQTPQPIVKGGKIAVIGTHLFQVESGMGIHVMDISNPNTPRKISFIRIPMCNEVTLRGNFLYTNNVNDLVTLNISDINNITTASRIINAFPNIEAQYPPQTNVYFECADISKGMVIGWELKKVNNPKCRR